jgi:hypothetical protein
MLWDRRNTMGREKGINLRATWLIPQRLWCLARCWGLMPIPNYSGGRDQEDHGLKPARANSS